MRNFLLSSRKKLESYQLVLSRWEKGNVLFTRVIFIRIIRFLHMHRAELYAIEGGKEGEAR